VSQTIQITLADDELFTGSRSLEIGLVSPVNVVVGSPSLYTITILDNEVCPTLTGWTLDGKNAYTTVSLPVDAPIIQLTGLTLTQQTGQQLKQIEMGTNNTIFQGNASGSPLTITSFKNGADLFIRVLPSRIISCLSRIRSPQDLIRSAWPGPMAVC
jgi:hypothetical protein